MALQLPFYSPSYGITFPTAYLRISGLNLYKVEDITPKFYVNVHFDIYTQAPESSLVQPIERKSLTISADALNEFEGDDFLIKSYKYLMSIPEYSIGLVT